MFKELTQKVEHFKAQAYEDSLTGFSNRSAFTRHMNALLSSTVNSDEGYIIIARLAHLNTINTTLGAQEGDVYVSEVAAALRKTTNDFPEKSFLFRVSGADFVIITEAISQDLSLIHI